MESLRPVPKQPEGIIGNETSSEEWLKRLRRLIETRLVGTRLPNDFSLDLFQEQILAAITRAQYQSTDWHGRVIRISMDEIKRAIASERRYYRQVPFRLDDVRHPSYRLDWIQFTFGQSASSEHPDEVSRQPDLMAVLRRRLTRREFKFLELRFLTIAPGKKRPYTIREIAALWGNSYDYLRHFAQRTLEKARCVIAETNERARTHA